MKDEHKGLPPWAKTLLIIVGVIASTFPIAWIWSSLTPGLSFEGAMGNIWDILLVILYFAARE